MLNTNLDTYKLGKILTPKKILKYSYEKELKDIYEKLHFNKLNYRVIFNIFIISFIISFIIYLYLFSKIFYIIETNATTLFKYFLAIFVIYTIITIIVYYVLLMFYYSYKEGLFRKKEEEIERVLPEFIDNLISNLKGGISIEKALLKSVPPNNPSFLKEVSQINSKLILGKSIYTALSEFRNKFNGAIIQRTFILILEGLKEGGNIEKSLEKISENLKSIYYLNDEIKGSSSGFAIVVRILTLFVTPILFSLSITLLSFISKLFLLFEKSQSDFLTFSKIPDEFFSYLIIFSYAMIILISIYSSLIVSHLKGEKIHSSIKYLVINIIVGIILYNLISDFLIDIFSNIL